MSNTVDMDLVATASTGGLVSGLIAYLIAGLVLSFVFAKADEPRWAAFVPFYNLYILTRMAGFNPLMFLIFLVPLANIVFAALIGIRIAKGFGRSTVFGIVGLWLFSLIGYLIVGLGSDKYDRAQVLA